MLYFAPENVPEMYNAEYFVDATGGMNLPDWDGSNGGAPGVRFGAVPQERSAWESGIFG